MKFLNLFTYGVSAPANCATCRDISISSAIRHAVLRYGKSDSREESCKIIFSHAMTGDRGHRGGSRFLVGHPNPAPVGVADVVMFGAEFQLSMKHYMKSKEHPKDISHQPLAGAN